jgi:alpha-1,3-rhamnosyl/mannosyltransferase
MALRIGLNAAALAAPRTGIGNYIAHLQAALAAHADIELFSFSGGHWQAGVAGAPQPVARGAVTLRLRGLAKPLLPLVRRWRHARQQRAFMRGASQHAIDVCHEPNYVPFEADVPTVITVHDLSWLRHPETHPPDRVRWLARAMPGAVERASAIIVDSDFTRGEMQSAFPGSGLRLHTVHLGVEGAFHPREAKDTAAALARLGLAHGEYVLTVGTLEPRKNIEHVLEAYARLPARLRDRYALAVAGAPGWRAHRLTRRLRALAASNHARFLAAVAQDDLPSLYAGAAAFVFPSIYEGFGLPPLEAMASGTPVLVAQRAALPEVVGDAAVRLDPEQPHLTAQRIEALLDDPAFAATLRERGLKRAAQFTWASCARKTIAVYRTALQAANR